MTTLRIITTNGNDTLRVSKEEFDILTTLLENSGIRYEVLSENKKTQELIPDDTFTPYDDGFTEKGFYPTND